ncbi:SPOR domain-containing protein [Helicobacter salomonis]|uniref:SPOR domain-containing protein n=1 Tax=Helicobacter salomonis TaxID=56878 RepID=UPI000CF0F102|nr:SPOR domain-containing protein [Helicobacter salomonis]
MDNSDFSKDLNKRLDEALNEHEAKGSKLKKILLIAAIGLIVLGVVLVVFYKSTREPLKSASMPHEEHLQKVGNLHDNTFNSNNFENLTLEPSTNAKKEEDKFDQIVKDIQAKQAQKVPEPSIVLPTSPLDKPVAPPPPPTPVSKPEPKPNEKKSSEKHKEHAAKSKHEKHEREKHEKVAQKTPEKKPAPKPEPKKAVAEKAPEKPKEAPKVAKAEPTKVSPKSEPSKSAPPTPQPKKMEEVAFDHVKGEKENTTKPQKPTIPKGFYLQVGVFSKTPNPKFMEAFVKYPHQIQELNGQKRYLIGPYPTREQADTKLEEVSHNIAKPVHVEIK